MVIFSISLGKFTNSLRKFPYRLRKFTHGKGIYIMYRDKLKEILKEKNMTYKSWSEESGVSIDTINRIVHPENPQKDSPRVNTLQDLCDALGVEIWEIFYTGDNNLVSLLSELTTLKAERDILLSDLAVAHKKIETLRDQVDSLKDEVINTHKYYMKQKGE